MFVRTYHTTQAASGPTSCIASVLRGPLPVRFEIVVGGTIPLKFARL